MCFVSFRSCVFALTAFLAVLTTPLALRAAEAAPVPPAPSLEQRVADLEGYLKNTPPSVNSAIAVPGPGHNAFMMLCTALVLFMTIPGLGLFYGGLVRSKNVLSVVGQCFGIIGLVTILWWALGYSLVFGQSFHSPFIGGLEYCFLNGVEAAPNTTYAPWISHSTFAMYQLMFAIITPAVLIGAVVERMKFMAVMTFVAFWMFVVYFPVTHMMWGVNGFMNGSGNSGAGIAAIDFAGGTVVEMNSGWSALVLCLILGKRIGFGKEFMPPHSMVLCMVGTGMLWVGWYGFNAGSALAADGLAANAFLSTTLTTAVASFVWGLTEYFTKGKCSILGFCSGAVAGLVMVTPACGYINASGAVILGIVGGIVPFFFCMKVKAWFKYDDALDVFGVHAVAGTVGLILTGVLASAHVNPNLAGTVAIQNGLAAAVANGSLWVAQLKAVGLTFLISTGGTALIGFGLKYTMGLRVSHEVERSGLDTNEHGEEGYIF